jgi:chitin synthase
MLTNAALAVSIENADGFVDDTNNTALEQQQVNLRKKQQFFFAVILWSTFGLSLVRFLGVNDFILTLPLFILTKNSVLVLLHQP